jgi:hypothetical protein
VTALNHPFSPAPLGNDLFAQFGDNFALPIVGNFDPPVAKSTAPTVTALAPLLGSTTMAAMSVNGEAWYSFQALRSGTVSVQATPASGDVHVNLFSDSYSLMHNGAAPAAGMAVASTAVTAGETYLVRITGSSADADLSIANAVGDTDRFDTTRDGRVTPGDVLKIINELLSVGVHATPMDMGNPTMYLDTSLDGSITSKDVLQVVNYLLSRPTSGLSAPSAAPAAVPAGAPAGNSPSGEADDAGAAVASAMAMSTSGDSAASAFDPAAADAVYTQLAAEEAQTAAAETLAADAAWADFDQADDDADDIDLDAELLP